MAIMLCVASIGPSHAFCDRAGHCALQHQLKLLPYHLPMFAQAHIMPHEAWASYHSHAAARRAALSVRATPAKPKTRPAAYHELTCLSITTFLQVHIAPYAACEGLFRGAAAALPPGRPLCLYGPFLRGQGNAPSNIGFDRMLRRHDPAWGVRDLARVQATAAERGLDMQEAVDMPSNNLLLVFKHRTADA